MELKNFEDEGWLYKGRNHKTMNRFDQKGLVAYIKRMESRPGKILWPQFIISM
jgi:hypothetical protein